MVTEKHREPLEYQEIRRYGDLEDHTDALDEQEFADDAGGRIKEEQLEASNAPNGRKMKQEQLEAYNAPIPIEVGTSSRSRSGQSGRKRQREARRKVRVPTPEHVRGMSWRCGMCGSFIEA